jgi:cyclase
MKVAVLSVAAFCTFALTAAQGQVASEALNMQNLNFDSLAIVTGGGGHSIAFSTDAGAVVLIDSKAPGFGPPLADAVKTWTDDKPVTTVINTHAHVDHVGGNSAFTGAMDFIAQEKTKRRMAMMEAFKGANARFLPNKTFSDRMSVAFGKDRLNLYYFGEGHTDGDAVVVIPDQRLAYLGDLFPGKTVPVVDANSGGSALAFPATLAKVRKEIQGVTRVIPSHATPPEGRRLHSQGRSWMSWADLQEFTDFTRNVVEAAQSQRRLGKNVDMAVDAVVSTLTKTYPAYSLDGARAMVQAVYDEMK